MKSLVSEKQPDLTTDPASGDTARRAREIVASLRGGGVTDVFEAFWQLDSLPRDEVSEALAPWTGPLPDPTRLDAATRLAHGLPPPPLRLRTLSVAHDADVLDLGPVAEEQLRIAGRTWDGADLAPEERLDGELEDSFAGTLERRVFGDAGAAGDAPLFDVLLFAEQSGVVFAAGSTSIVALIAYGKVEMRDRRTREALTAALAERGAAGTMASRVGHEASVPPEATPPVSRSAVPPDPDEAAHEPPAHPERGEVEPLAEGASSEASASTDAPSKSAVAKRAATTRASAKKKGAGRPAPRTPPAKKRSGKGTAAVKSTARKAPVKKTAAKKVAAKKSPAKKAPAKKASSKRAPAKKTSAKGGSKDRARGAKGTRRPAR